MLTTDGWLPLRTCELREQKRHRPPPGRQAGVPIGTLSARLACRHRPELALLLLAQREKVGGRWRSAMCQPRPPDGGHPQMPELRLLDLERAAWFAAGGGG
jgi:hypothetical protein